MLNVQKKLVATLQAFNFLACYKVERNARIKIKLLALYHLQQGKDFLDEAAMLLVTERIVRSWIRRSSAFDYEGLMERLGRGRKPQLSPSEEENFKDEIDRLHAEKKGGRVTASEIQELLLSRFDCNYSIFGSVCTA